MKKQFVLGAVSLLVVVMIGCEKMLPPAPASSEIIAEPTEGLTPDQVNLFIQGDELFAHSFKPDEGLGPIFIQSSCEGCHVGDGKGHIMNTLTRFGKSNSDGSFDYMLDKGGPQLQHRAIPGYAPEELPAGVTNTSTRIAPIVIGMGFLAAVHDSTLLNLADEFDADGDGISGRPNYVMSKGNFSPEDVHIPSNGMYIGRFGKKAKEMTLKDQVVFALKQDIGLTSDYDTEDPVNFAVSNNAVDEAPDPEAGSDVVEKLTFYMRTLKAPTRRNEDDPDVLAGEQIFQEIGCAKCHTPTLKTGVSEIAAISEKEFHPYTDLLLHDMGSALDDGYPEGSATGSEWRTPPLWGLGLAEDSQGGVGFYLHDGRATSLEDAIGYHSTGEAASIASNFEALSAGEKEQLIQFLKSL